MSTTMHRLQISIPQWEKQFLEERAERDGVSVAEVIRQLIEREAEVERTGVDSILALSGIGKMCKPLIDGIPVSENTDIYLNRDILDHHQLVRERPSPVVRRRKTRKS